MKSKAVEPQQKAANRKMQVGQLAGPIKRLPRPKQATTHPTQISNFGKQKTNLDKRFSKIV